MMSKSESSDDIRRRVSDLARLAESSVLHENEFEPMLRERGESMTERDLRRLVFAYCQRYEDIYPFDQLEIAFAYLDIVFNDQDLGEIHDELPTIRAQVEVAMAEYFTSLNEVAAAINRLLDDVPMTIDDVLKGVDHVWNAYACNEDPSDFEAREDRILCELLREVCGK